MKAKLSPSPLLKILLLTTFQISEKPSANSAFKTRNGEKTLAELNVSRLTVDQAVAVIQTRVDLEL